MNTYSIFYHRSKQAKKLVQIQKLCLEFNIKISEKNIDIILRYLRGKLTVEEQMKIKTLLQNSVLIEFQKPGQSEIRVTMALLREQQTIAHITISRGFWSETHLPRAGYRHGIHVRFSSDMPEREWQRVIEEVEHYQVTLHN